ncbi:MAG: ABC transporter ATP-binding protein [Flavobacteriales bacterium]
MSTVALHIKNLEIGFGKRSLVTIDHFSIKTGQLTALIGRNGVGKSTLLKKISGLLAVEKGKIFIQEKDITSFNPASLAKELACVFHSRQTPPSLRVKTVVEMGRFAHGDAHTQMGEQIVNESLTALGIHAMQEELIDHLSDGEFQKVAVARAVAQKTTILLLDEPTAHLDYIAREELIQQLKTWAHEKNLAILFTSHDIDLVHRYADCIWELENGALTIRTSFV